MSSNGRAGAASLREYARFDRACTYQHKLCLDSENLLALRAMRLVMTLYFFGTQRSKIFTLDTSKHFPKEACHVPADALVTRYILPYSSHDVTWTMIPENQH
eukprot:6183388-Pleurochrysis_carterae.AAC.1